MDRIYARGFKVEHCQLMTGQPWRTLSDHCALMAELSLIEEPDLADGKIENAQRI